MSGAAFHLRSPPSIGTVCGCRRIPPLPEREADMNLAVFLLIFSTAAQSGSWRPLFDGKTLSGWKVTEFGGIGTTSIEGGTIVLGTGNPMSGITWTGDAIARSGYELELDAMRVSGSDIFCGLTFPVEDSHCSLIVGGWGGSIVGLSSLDGLDASENETSIFMMFENQRWYRVRVRVEPDRIRAWIDDKQVVDADIKGRKLSVRSEMLDSRPLGSASWQTTSALRNIRIREVR